jgi:hypothetical protein
MRFISKNAAIVACCFIFALVFVAPAVIHSDEWNLTTRFTINHAFEVPGMVLQPNTRYVIRLYDSPAERHVVEIFNGDQTKLLTTFMAVSDQRAEPADNTVFTFIETAPGYPVPMKEWFYPGRITGLEFIYPKQQAKEIAQHAIEPVLSASTSDLHDLASVEVEAIQPLGKETPVVATSAANITKVENAPAAAEEKPTTPAVTEEAAPTVQENENQSTSTVEENQQQNQTESQSTVTNETEAQQEKPAETSVTTEQSQNQQPTELPRTAGELPLVVLLGMLCLGAGLGMRVLSSKS